ncbi:MAG TPA: DUF6491 family protein [Steroidobacteraceae bacterium]|jgi:hypothetical protein
MKVFAPIKHCRSWLLPMLLLLAACAGIGRRADDQTERDRYAKYAGAPIDHFTWLGHFDGWAAVGPYQLVLWTRVDQAYLVTVQSPCTDLEFTQRVGVTSTAGTVSHLDSVTFDHQRCPITEIRPIDYGRMRHDARAAAAH